MRHLSATVVLCVCGAAHAQFGFVQRIDVPPPAKALDEWIAPGFESSHFRIRSESIMLGSREDLAKHLEGVHGQYLQSLGLSAYMGTPPLASAEAAEKAVAEAEGEGKLVRRTSHATVHILPDRTLVSVREGGKKVVTFPDGSRASWDGESWTIATASERLRGRCDVWLLPETRVPAVGCKDGAEVSAGPRYRAFMASYYPDRSVAGNAFYDPDADTIVAWNSPDHRAAITGELVRRLLSCAFGATPPWLEEGLSRLTRDSESGQIRPLDVETTRRLRYMVLKGAYVSVAELIDLSPAEFDDSVNRPLYGLQSAGVVELLARVDEGRQFHSFLKALRKGGRQKDAFKTAFAGPRKAQSKWLQFLVSGSTKITSVERLSLLRTERRDVGPGGRGNMFTARIRQKTGAPVQGVELWVYMVIRPRDSTSAQGHLALGRWRLGELPEGDKNINGTLSDEEKAKWGNHPDAVRAELYWNGRLVDVDVNGHYAPLQKWWILLEPVKWLNR